METSARTSNSRFEHGLEQSLLRVEPQFRERVWGGQLLHPSQPPTGEGWLAYSQSVVTNGALAGRKMADLADQYGPDLLGSTVFGRFGPRFPLLAKILDCADWLSVQVHPNDEQAARLVGPGSFGKTEAWFILDAAPEARILLGVKPGITPPELEAAIREGRVGEIAQEVRVRKSEAALVPAGTLHAVGPGLLIFEIQQDSDITYRVYDWGRPQSAGRSLHIEESVQVTTTAGPLDLVRPAIDAGTGMARAIECRQFVLDLARVGATPLQLDTEGRSFQIVTALGPIEIEVPGMRLRLGRFESAVVAGGTGEYRISAPEGPATLLKAAVPD